MNASSARQHAVLRSALISLASTLAGVLAVIGILSLFSVWSMNRAWERGVDALELEREISWLSVQAQADFKRQMDEWQRMLLRGADPAALSRARREFDVHGRSVASHLERFAAQADGAGLQELADMARALRGKHDILGANYRSALARGVSADGSLEVSAATRLDDELRGVDLELDSDIDVMARRVLEMAEADRDSLSQRMSQRYRVLRFALVATLSGSLVLVALGLYGALRATRGA
jgi:hypothetical protein